MFNFFLFTKETLFRGHPDKQPTSLERPLGYINLNIPCKNETPFRYIKTLVLIKCRLSPKGFEPRAITWVVVVHVQDMRSNRALFADNDFGL